MVMDMFPVQVGGNHHLKPVPPQPMGQFHPDFMGLFRRDLPRGEGLIAMKGDNAALFPKLPLHHHHLLPGDFRGAVHAADIPLFFGFVVLGGVIHHVPQPL